MAEPKLKLYNTLSGERQEFSPLDPENVRMYVCGPTVYARPHVGNARAVVVYDVLFRLLKQLYHKVTYIRNITDVDDKINQAARENGEPISALTKRITEEFHADMKALGNLPPTEEPRATEHMNQIIEMIEKLLKNGNAYEADGHVLFSVKSAEGYGRLSGRNLDELIAGARVEVESYKKDAGDFVLWKPAGADDDPSSIFESPWGAGRPGWHIECSAMSTEYLGETFDIHGGGADLKFPHHENEIAQSCCANPGSEFAKFWVHNGFVTVNGEKMAKSAGNFTTVRELLEKGVKGEVIRYVLLATHYRKPLDFSGKAMDDAKKALDGFYRIVQDVKPADAPDEIIEALLDDMNTPRALAFLHSVKDPAILKSAACFLGLMQEDEEIWFKGDIDAAKIEELIEKRAKAKAEKDWAKADEIRDELTNMGVILEDGATGTIWRKA